jgi:Endonuclease/Exonuclease/phosphatase family.
MKPDLATIHSMRAVADQVYPFVPTTISLVDLIRRHNYRDEEPRSLTRLLRRWSPKYGATVFRILWQNTFLMKIVGQVDVQLPIGFVEKDVVITEKPDTVDRALEFGIVLSASDFDGAFLCEVWTDEVKTPLMLPLLPKIQGVAEGPPSDTSRMVVTIGSIAPMIAKIGSGLLVFSMARPILEQTYHIFSNPGSLPRDADALSKKSVLLSRVNIGAGIIDFYSTHLYNGNDLTGEKPSPTEKSEIQASQIDEVVQFIQQTHRNENIATLMGDFNIDARDATVVANGVSGYEALTAALAKVDLFDIWPFQFPLKTSIPPGITVVGNDETATLPGSCTPLPAPPSEPGFCNEGVPSTSGGGRIDYLFVEKSKSSHAMNLVVGAVLRKYFPRSGSYPLLSDHLGLAFNLICSQP